MNDYCTWCKWREFFIEFRLFMNLNEIGNETIYSKWARPHIEQEQLAKILDLG